MPTGYTHAIEKGISFQEFALSCARAFGALITMRDEPSDAPIPDEFLPSEYNKEALQKAQEQLVELKALSIELCESRAMADYKAELERHENYIADKKELEKKYRSMLNEVNAWTPPTADHVGLKEFMKEQIEESIDFDCNTKYLTKPKLLTAVEWLNSKTEKALRDIEYHTKGNNEEIERVAGRNRWVKELKKSLTGQMST